jgi:tetratricopeptide (TPR) repeat protein
VLALHVIAQVGEPATSACDETTRAYEANQFRLIAEGYDAAAVLGEAVSPTATQWAGDWCQPLRLMRWTLIGWSLARALAEKGGALELVGPTRKIIDRDLEALHSGDLALEAEYAQTAIRAAIAAAQDERPEMTLLLEHARDLTERLHIRGRRAMWPLPYNLLAGELWFEVDHYAEAAAAFERATESGGTPRAWAGLARTYARLGNRSLACRSYRTIEQAAPNLLAEAKAFLRSCQ